MQIKPTRKADLTILTKLGGEIRTAIQKATPDNIDSYVFQLVWRKVDEPLWMNINHTISIHTLREMRKHSS